MSAARRRRAAPQPPNPAGAHALAERAATRLVRDAGVTPDDLVLDIGAGLGAVTRPLARTGARVIAVERDHRVGERLRHRISGWDNVTVVIADALTVPLPHRRFRVVANIPFAITTALLRRLVESRMTAADLVVAVAAGRRLAGTITRPEQARWHARFDFSLGTVIPASWFHPAPPVDAVVLRLRRRPSARHPVRDGRRTRRSGRVPR